MSYQLVFIQIKVTSLMIPIPFILLLVQACVSFRYDHVFTTNAHSQLVTTLTFFNDKQRFITGANDNKTRIWSVTNFTMLHQMTFSDYVMNVGLHPVDNRIFVLVYDGNIFVYDPVTYAQIHTFTYPTYNANYILFEKYTDRFILGGYDGAGVVPNLYFYNATTYASITSVATGLPASDEVNSISMNPAATHIVISNLGTTNTIYKIEVYKLSDLSLVSSFTDGTDKIRWTIYSNVDDFFCSTNRDLSIRCYQYSTTTHQYSLRKNWTATSYPYCMGFGFAESILVTVNRDIVFYLISLNTSFTKEYFVLNDVAPIFVMDNTPDMGYLATGMQHGQVSLWKFVPDQQSKSDQAVQEIYSQMDSTKNLAIGLGAGLGGLALIIIIAAVCCLCGCCDRCRKRVNQEQDESMNQLTGDQQGHDQLLVIKDDQHRSNGSSDVDYDELMAHGTVIVIKDEDKKRKYVENLKKKQKNNDKVNQDNLDGFLNVKGHIIIIRDDEHSEYKKNKNKNFSDKSSDIDYQELMAEGNVIIIKDEDVKQKFINKLKKKDNNTNYQALMAEGNIIIIRGEEQQKIYLKQMQKQQDLKNIRHDQVLAQGDVIVIKDNQKKKEFVNKMKKQLQKNNQNARDLLGVEVAEQIIVICGDDDEDMTYEQLMAQGTVIVIKDDETKKEYRKYTNKQNKKISEKMGKGSEKSSDPEYDTLMAEECIIVIKDDDDKRNFAQFIKNRRLHSEKSSEMDYDELMNNGNIMSIREDNTKAKRNNSSGNINSVNRIEVKAKDQNYEKIMAEKNVIVINEESGQPLHESQLKDINKTFPLKK